MQKSLLKFICTFFCIWFSISCHGFQNPIRLTVPKVDIDQKVQVAKAEFARRLQEIARPMNRHFARPILGIAPMGGTKLTAFKELGLDGLVIIDWDRPGTPDMIRKTFEDPDLRAKLIYSLQEGLNFGGMSTSTIMQTPISAQLLARLWYELDVSSVRVQFYLQKNVAHPAQNIQLWDGSPVGDGDIALVTRFLFNYHNQPKELVYISSKVTADSVTWRDALPMEILQSLAPEGYLWGYLSADGLIFFSKKSDNGLSKGNHEFLDLLSVGGAVVLDYPQLPAYTKCFPTNVYDGITSMCGRADLENWGLKVIERLQLSQHVFGYVGFTPKDEVRIYLKSYNTVKNTFISSGTIFSMSNLTQMGDDYNFELTGEKIVRRRDFL